VVLLVADGRRLVLSGPKALFAVDAEGQPTLIHDLTSPDFALPFFLDVAAVSNSEVAVIAENDGYLLDLEKGTLRQHFCYEPGFIPDENYRLSLAVAFEPTENRVWAQPRTFSNQSAVAPLNSQLAAFDRETGRDLNWVNLPDATFAATAGLY
jgi:hypothetical protein